MKNATIGEITIFRALILINVALHQDFLATGSVDVRLMSVGVCNTTCLKTPPGVSKRPHGIGSREERSSPLQAVTAHRAGHLEIHNGSVYRAGPGIVATTAVGRDCGRNLRIRWRRDIIS